MALPLIPILLIAAAGVAVAVAAGGKRYALTEDCQLSTLSNLTPEESQQWVEQQLLPAFTAAADGKAVIKIRGPMPLPPELLAELEGIRVALQKPVSEGGAGLTAAQAEQMAGVHGDVVHIPAEPGDAFDVALYCYQQLAHPNCAIATLAAWGQGETISFPSAAAECLFRAIVIAVKMQFFATTGDKSYEITQEDVEAAIKVCPAATQQASAGGRVQHPSAAPFPNVGGYGVGFNTRAIAHDANRGVLHPVRVLTGEVFR